MGFAIVWRGHSAISASRLLRASLEIVDSYDYLVEIARASEAKGRRRKTYRGSSHCKSCRHQAAVPVADTHPQPSGNLRLECVIGKGGKRVFE